MMLARTAVRLCRQVHTTPLVFNQSFIDRMKYHWNHQFRVKPKLSTGAEFLYEACVDQVNAQLWLKHFELPDTYISWFQITELHVWMCLLKAMSATNPSSGRYLRNEIIKNMWADCERRMKMLGPMAVGVRRDAILDCAKHFQLIMPLYDEGIYNDDRVLANALWRGVLGANDKLDNLSHLRTLVHYVRRNVNYLDSMKFADFVKNDTIVWKPLEESIAVTRID